MAWSLTVTPGADRIYLSGEVDGAAISGKVYRSCVAEDSHLDILDNNVGGPGTFSLEDTHVLQENRYYYALTDEVGIGFGGNPYATGSASLFQPKAFGRKGGGHARRRVDYDVECELCGFKVSRNLLRRGYVKPHVAGENWVPYSADSSGWDWSIDPLRFDANTWSFQQGWDRIFYFPQTERPLEKTSRYGGGHRYAGTPLIRASGAPTVSHPGGCASDGEGYAILWIYPLFSPYNIKYGKTVTVSVWQDGSQIASQTIGPYDVMDAGWKKIVMECTWVASSQPFQQKFTTTGDSDTCLVLGGLQITTSPNPHMACLPDRKTALGEYTIGGMMELCSDCYSGLRRRVPWE